MFVLYYYHHNYYYSPVICTFGLVTLFQISHMFHSYFDQMIQFLHLIFSPTHSVLHMIYSIRDFPLSLFEYWIFHFQHHLICFSLVFLSLFSYPKRLPYFIFCLCGLGIHSRDYSCCLRIHNFIHVLSVFWAHLWSFLIVWNSV